MLSTHYKKVYYVKMRTLIKVILSIVLLTMNPTTKAKNVDSIPPVVVYYDKRYITYSSFAITNMDKTTFSSSVADVVGNRFFVFTKEFSEKFTDIKIVYSNPLTLYKYFNCISLESNLADPIISLKDIEKLLSSSRLKDQFVKVETDLEVVLLVMNGDAKGRTESIGVVDSKYKSLVSTLFTPISTENSLTSDEMFKSDSTYYSRLIRDILSENLSYLKE